MPSSRSAPRIALAPEGAPGWMAEAIRTGGGQITDLADAEALVWGAPKDPHSLAPMLEQAHHLKWIQLPYAGVEDFLHLIDDERVWTCGKGVYAEPVGELALGLAIAGMRGVSHYARARGWTAPRGTNLQGSRVTILGGGAITEVLLRLLAPFDCHVTVVRNHAVEMAGADDVLEADRLHDALPGSDVVFVALALTQDTEGIMSATEFGLLESHSWLVNVARGRHVVTGDLVDALSAGTIGGAALDVTDPEPLPDDHALWSLPNCIITPHVGNTPEMAQPLLAARITENVRRYAAGEDLIGLVDVELGY